jgi:hypothetical protein
MMENTSNGWTRGLRLVAPLALVALLAQGILGFVTNYYGPAAGFTPDTSFPALSAHYALGYILGILGLLAMVFAAMSRQLRLLVFAIVLFVGVVVAGISGSAFVDNTPNPQNFSLVMAFMFVVAFVGATGIMYILMGQRPTARVPGAGTPAP